MTVPWFAALPCKLDRGLLYAVEFFFGPRDSWEWWRRRLGKRGLLDD